MLDRVRDIGERVREKNFHLWLPAYLRWLVQRPRPRVEGPRHILFALCDHYEPGWADASREVGDARVRAWSDGYPPMAREFHDADGHHPRHSFFFPGEQYTPGWLD